MNGCAWGRGAGVAITLVLSACATGVEPAVPAAADVEACSDEVAAFAAQLQAHVDRYDGVDPLTFATDESPPATLDLPTALASHEQRLSQLGCDPAAASAELALALDDLRTDGAVPSAVAGALRAAVAGTVETAGRRIEVSPDDDLAALALSAPPGSVLALAPGEHLVDETVLVAQRLAIVGQDRDATTIVSTADEVALLVAGSGELELSGVTIVHDGGPTSAVVFLLSPWYELRDVAVTGGQVADDGTGGTGLLVAQGPTVGPNPARAGVDELGGRLERIEVRDNDGAGIAIQRDAVPRIVDAEVSGNGPCGVCYLGSAGGSLTDSLVWNNEIGVLVGGTSDPQLVRSRIQENRVDGILVEARARGSYRDLEVADNVDRGPSHRSGQQVPRQRLRRGHLRHGDHRAGWRGLRAPAGMSPAARSPVWLIWSRRPRRAGRRRRHGSRRRR